MAEGRGVGGAGGQSSTGYVGHVNDIGSDAHVVGERDFVPLLLEFGELCGIFARFAAGERGHVRVSRTAGGVRLSIRRDAKPVLRRRRSC